MTQHTKGLAVLLRRTQWMLDDLAFQVGAGHLDTDDLSTAALALDEMAQLLRETATDDARLSA
ncbi:hypothetical protein MOQ72_29630 [Saccharopolyspora sp. K220]|nr:hypothetical protein [Saccharopolyspora soli]